VDSVQPVAEAVPRVGLFELFRVFSLIGVSSFGGGLSGWMYRELVEGRRWISAEEFVTGLSLARTMPGANVVNLSIWIGFRLRRSLGAMIACVGVLAGPMVIIIILAMAYGTWRHSKLAHSILLGVAAASLGIGLSVGAKTVQMAARTPVYALVAAAAFFTVGVLRWPMLPVVAVLGPVSIAWTLIFDPARKA
jgi:chromate transporter